MLYPEMYLLAVKTAEGTLPLLKEFPLPASGYNILLSLSGEKECCIRRCIRWRPDRRGNSSVTEGVPSASLHTTFLLSSGEKECCIRRCISLAVKTAEGTLPLLKEFLSARGYNIPTLWREGMLYPEMYLLAVGPQRELFRY